MNCYIGNTKSYYKNCKSCQKNGCKDCLPGYYKSNENGCNVCPFGPCAECYNENICKKCKTGFIRLRYDFNNIKCVMLDDRMNINNCSMYMSENNQIKCIDCIAGYKMDFGKNMCVKREKDDKIVDIDALLDKIY